AGGETAAAAHGPVAGERAVVEGGVARVVEAAAPAAGERALHDAGAPERQVVPERALADEESRAAGVENATALAVAGLVDGLAVGHSRAGKGQAARILDAGPLRGPAVGDRQAGDAYRGPGGDLEDPAGIAAADCQAVGAWAGDGQVVRDGQFAAGRRDDAAGGGGKGNHVRAEVVVGVEDGLPQRPGTVVGEVRDGEGAEQRPVFQALQPGHEGTLPLPFWARPGVAPGAGLQESKQRNEPHGATS